ncbi:5924_t:CDS:2, partial [Racocetra fulgida]
PLMQDQKSPESSPLMQDHQLPDPPMISNPQQTPTTNLQNGHDFFSDPLLRSNLEKGEAEDIEATDGHDFFSNPLLRSNLESLMEPSSGATLDPSELIKVHQVRDTLDKMVSTSDVFRVPEGPKKYRVVVLPKGKALHFVYKVLVFPKGKYSQPKVFTLMIIPGKTTERGKKVTFIVVPKDAPGNWKKFEIYIKQ